MAFYQRILLATWGVFILSVAIGLVATELVPERMLYAGPPNLAESSVQQVAQQLRGPLQQGDVSTAAELLASEALDFRPLVEIYVIDAAGRDILDRRPPRRVEEEFARTQTHQLPIVRDALGGFTIIGDTHDFPLARILSIPRGRLFMLLTSLSVSGLICGLLARFIVLPVRRMREAGRRVADGDLTVRVAHTVGTRSDDIASLARDFDRMTERVELLLGEQRRLMRDVSHELRSPLARLLALISISRQHAAPAHGHQFDRMEQELGRIDDLIGSILSFSHLADGRELQLHTTDLVDLLVNIVDDASLEAQVDDKHVHLHAPEKLLLSIDGGILGQAVENVIRNAVRHTPPGGTVGVTVSQAQQRVEIIVDDAGSGVPEDALEHLFAPFFRVEEGRGTRTGSGGLGLAIAERSVALHGGTIGARNRQSGGLSVRISVPST
ncbi:MAG: ATP-binding protein [Pseudomonadota bacterium]